MQDIFFLLKATFLGIVEGITEFLPISSTAHLLIIGDWIGFDAGQDKVYEIVIQLGSILAVMWIYRQRIGQLCVGTIKRQRSELLFVRNLLLAFLPAAIIGLMLIKYIKAILNNVFIVYAITLVLGGLIMLWVENRPGMAKHSTDEHVKGQTTSIEDISIKQALIVGFAQCLAMIPGTSRSGSTIIAGMFAGIQRKTATEFSFFLAMPTMIAATALSLYKYGSHLSDSNLLAVGIGFLFAFLSALIVVKGLLLFVSKYSYRPFAWYRIIFGLVVAWWVLS
ncbi:undecaprenyl-diphosphate phosphatase [Pelistega europaea]|uniref:Undecaprenyl-diphosphatase n=2 Tax=Pelistega europaea TaxID=106147 RepID=A0A7Y4L9K8_9BURK|nr:undecaprenyl-diphosphate phosphatase [Pelistega europaea]NOL49449.1 undecaprenyl-diphosphate phosphatase [Pelistega europaea]